MVLKRPRTRLFELVEHAIQTYVVGLATKRIQGPKNHCTSTARHLNPSCPSRPKNSGYVITITCDLQSTDLHHPPNQSPILKKKISPVTTTKMPCKSNTICRREKLTWDLHPVCPLRHALAEIVTSRTRECLVPIWSPWKTKKTHTSSAICLPTNCKRFVAKMDCKAYTCVDSRQVVRASNLRSGRDWVADDFWDSNSAFQHTTRIHHFFSRPLIVLQN